MCWKNNIIIHIIIACSNMYCIYTLQVCFLRFFLNGTTEADFSPRIDEFEAVIGESLYVAVQKNIMLYYTAMVAEIQHVPSETM